MTLRSKNAHRVLRPDPALPSNYVLNEPLQSTPETFMSTTATIENSSRSGLARRTLRIIAATLSALVVVLTTTIAPGGAHADDQSYLYLDVSDLELAGRVEFPLSDVETVFGIDFTNEASDDDTLALIDERLGELQAYADEHLSISSADGTELAVAFEGRSLLSTDKFDQDNNYVWLPFELSGYDTPAPREFVITFDPFFDEVDGRDALIVIENDVEGGIYNNEADFLVAFDADSRTQEVDLGDASALKNLTASIELGVDHIKTGPDHVLFVLVLLIPSVLVFRKSWHPTASFFSSLWRVLKIATMFTIAHSITFSLAGLGILPLPPSKFVEAIIAISIALAAIHSVRPVFPNKEWLIAFAFGLFHGMGFATLVEGLDVSRSTQLVSLLGRNIGIEIGQVAVIVACFPGLYFLRRTRFYMPFLKVSAAVMSFIAIGWMIERLAEIELGINDIVDPLVVLPRALIVIAIATAAAYGIFKREEAADRLLPTIDELDTPPPADERIPTMAG